MQCLNRRNELVKYYIFKMFEFSGGTCICNIFIQLRICSFEYPNTADNDPLRCDMSLTMAGLEVRARSLLTKASSCWMSAGGGSMRTGSRQDRVDSWTPWLGHDKASNSRDRS